MRKQTMIPLAMLGALYATQPAGAADLRGTFEPAAAPAHMLEPLPSTLPFFLHVGGGSIRLNEGAKMTVGGALVPNATLSVAPQLTAVVEVGYFVTPNIAVSFTGGVPPTIDIIGRGAAAAFGRLGRATYGPTTLTAHYHFKQFGNIQPYIGAGPTFMIVFGSKDAAITGLKVNHAVGFAVQLGANIMIDERWGTFIDIKKAYLRTIATGTLAGGAARAKVTLDPLVIHSGVTYRF